MSGGSWRYFFHELQDVADCLEAGTDLDGHATEVSTEAALERIRLGALLSDAADVLRTIEWVDSCDYGPDEEVGEIRKFLDKIKAQ